MGKLLAGVGLLFFGYCFLQVVTKWPYRSAIEKAIWFVFIAIGGGYCIAVLIR